MRKPGETCPVCRLEFRKKDERYNIKAYGMCAKCSLEKLIGHTYKVTTWDCECGKKFSTKARFDSHKTSCKYKPVEKVIWNF